MSYSVAAVDGDGFAKAAFMSGAHQLAHRFLSRIFALNRDHPGIRIVVAWDRQDSGAERCRIFEDYKANRRDAPDRFGVSYRAEVEKIREILQALGVSSAESTGWEADDVIATVVRRANSRDQRLVLTRDRDLLQLVSRDVDVLLRVKSEDHVVTVGNVANRIGLPVGLYRDLKALAGDVGDGVPGVPGVGEKRAIALLRWNGKVIAEICALGKSQGDVPRELQSTVAKVVDAGREYLRAMVFLVSLHEVPLEVRRGSFDLDLAAELMSDMRLRKLSDRLGEWSAPPRRVRRLK